MKDTTRCFGLPWTAADKAALLRMRADGVPWADIAGELGRSEQTCRTIYCNLRDKSKEPPHRRAWTADEVAQMIRLREVECLPWSKIDAQLGRTAGGSAQKYESLRLPKKTVAPHLTGGRIDDAAALAERAQRRDLTHPTLTAAFFGDPLPGRSALDKIRSGEAELDAARRGARLRLPAGLSGDMP